MEASQSESCVNWKKKKKKRRDEDHELVSQLIQVINVNISPISADWGYLHIPILINDRSDDDGRYSSLRPFEKDKQENVTHLSWRGKDLLSSFDDNIIAALIELLINITVKKGTKT